jgi:hypothetical protein
MFHATERKQELFSGNSSDGLIEWRRGVSDGT